LTDELFERGPSRNPLRREQPRLNKKLQEFVVKLEGSFQWDHAYFGIFGKVMIAATRFALDEAVAVKQI
jgi:hypothetical protein